jgi:hypothetical protein
MRSGRSKRANKRESGSAGGRRRGSDIDVVPSFLQLTMARL